jgi:hypothetical protein
VVAGNPTGALFGAFLGENPMGLLLAATAQVPGWTPLSTTVTQTLLAPHFFASAIAPAFSHALGEAFVFAGAVTALGALVSSQRGEKYIYGEEPARSRRQSSPSTVPPASEAVPVPADTAGQGAR